MSAYDSQARFATTSGRVNPRTDLYNNDPYLRVEQQVAGSGFSKTIGGGGYEDVEQHKDILRAMRYSTTNASTQQRRNRDSYREDGDRNFERAVSWIGQQKRLIETAPWGNDSATIKDQIFKHNQFHSSIQRSLEVERAKEELVQRQEKAQFKALEQEWESLQKMSFNRLYQLQDLENIINEISKEIMWVNEHEERELVFDWGEKHIDDYIPKKQESYSRLMRDLEEKEKGLNKLKQKVDNLLKTSHPASDKIHAYMDTLQTQWSWLLQITKCIDIHLKENSAYSQFFKEANETYTKLQKEHDNIRKTFTCDRNTPLENLLDLIKNLEREKERILANKRQVQHLVNMSKTIVRLKPRNPEEKNNGPVMVEALCDFRQDQKVILKGDEGILKDNSQRSKWHVTGPGGLDMLIPSVCLLIPPPNNLSINLAKTNEKYFEAIMEIWNQLYVNIKSLVSWRYCIEDINRIHSLTVKTLARMNPEEYRTLIKRLETHYQEFMRNSHGSEMFREEDRRKMESQYTGAQTHYETLVINLHVNQDAELKKVPEVPKTDRSPPSMTLLMELHQLRQRLDAAQFGLAQHLPICLRVNGTQEGLQELLQLEGIHRDISLFRDEYITLREKTLTQLEGMMDSDKANFLRAELDIINQKLGSLEGFSFSLIQRLKALLGLLQSVRQAEDIIKVHEARLTEKETSSLNLNEMEDYRTSLKEMQSELEFKKDIIKSMAMKLSDAVHWNSQMGQSYHQRDVGLSMYTELVDQLSNRWQRIQTQVDSRIWDLQKQQQQLKHLQQKSSQLSQWVDETNQRQETLQAGTFGDIQALIALQNQQKMLFSEIKGKKEKFEDMQKDANTCVASIKDYELQLASYSAGLETLLNIPVKITVPRSPTHVIWQEAAELQSRYIELFTHASDYNRFLAEMLKSMEELKIRNTRIDLLEEELRRLKEDIQDRSLKNKSLEDSLARCQVEITEYKVQLLSSEESKRTQAVLCSAAKDNLNSTYSQVKDLGDQVSKLTFLIDEEKRKRRLAEERYTNQREEYELITRKRQKELDEINWSKIDVEKTIKDKEREIERLKMQLEDETSRRRKLESDISKTSSKIHESQTNYSELLQEKESLLLKMKLMEQEKTRMQKNEEDLSRVKLSLESELRLKLRLQDEKEQIRKDLNYWKGQYELKDVFVRQYNSEKAKAEREQTSLKSEIERLMLELRTVEGRYKERLLNTERDVSALALARDNLERELNKLRQRPDTFSRPTQTVGNMATVVDPSKLLFDGVRRKVTAHQLCDCGIIDKVTFSQLLNGQRTVEDVAVEIQLSLKGTGVIAGMVGGPQGRISIMEAKAKNLLTPESATMLLEAQAASGYIIDPKINEKMSVDTAFSRGLVDAQNKDTLTTAEAAVTGFKDPFTGKLLSAGQAMQKGQIDKETTLRYLQAQECIGGILDPVLSVFLSKDAALDRNLINEDLYRALNKRPACYIDPATQQKVSYHDLKMKCRLEPATGQLLLPAPDKSLCFKGIRWEVSLSELLDSKLLDPSEVENLGQGKITVKDVEDKLRSYLQGSSSIAGIYDEEHDRILPIYQAMKEGLLMRGTSLELLEAQAASGFIIDPINNLYLTVDEAWRRGLVGKEFKSKLLSAEKAVTGYQDPQTGKTISLFQAIEKELIEKGHGIRLLEAQIASGGIIDPKASHRINVDVAYSRGYFDKDMNETLMYEGDDTKGFFDPNTQENLTYLQLKERCVTDKKTGLILLPLKDKKKKNQQQKTTLNTLRKRKVVIIDPDLQKEMTVREAYHRELIDYDTFLELSEQEGEWEEITITTSDGSTRRVVVDRKTGQQYDIQDSLNRGIIDQNTLEKYRSGTLSLTEFADQIVNRKSNELFITSSSAEDIASCTSPAQLAPASPTARKRLASVSITFSPPSEMLDDQSPVAAIFDTETLEKVTISEAQRRGIVDSITAQRLLEAQACTGGIINPANSQRLSLQDAVHHSIIDKDMALKLKPAYKAYVGFEDVKTKRKMSAVEAMKENWLPYEAGQRFLEFQYLTGGLIEPKTGQRVTVEEAIRNGWLDGQGAQNLQDTRNHARNLTCPKTKLKISYKEAMDNCMVEETNGMKMLQATSMSSKGISSPYNVSSGPPSRSGSRAGSRAGSRTGSRRGSVDLTSSFSYTYSSLNSSSLS